MRKLKDNIIYKYKFSLNLLTPKDVIYILDTQLSLWNYLRRHFSSNSEDFGLKVV